MADEREHIEQETQHGKKQAATQNVPVDDADADAEQDQETQHPKKQAARNPDNRRE